VVLIQQVEDHLFSDAGRIVRATLAIRSDTEYVRPRERHTLAASTLHNDALRAPTVDRAALHLLVHLVVSRDPPNDPHLFWPLSLGYSCIFAQRWPVMYLKVPS
jgi:hypothetical protein